VRRDTSRLGSQSRDNAEEPAMRSIRARWDIWDLALMAGVVVLAVAAFMYG
jgi:hypothetical protein